uniref:Uncharacterized protein n=1 Tax=viral metagenome TaxID=1070528 RepID=A0A6C0EQS2_9ZZZZ
MQKSESKTEKNSPPENFIVIVRDFVKDLTITFPEYAYLWVNWTDAKLPESEIQKLYDYCISVYPERFFDILYQNDEIFNSESTTNTTFLPNVDFKILYNCDNVSENTRKAIWKYLQLLLFTIVNYVKDKNDFGDTMNMFDGIDETELQNKLNETFSSIGDFFKNMEENINTNERGDENSEMPMPNMKDFFKFAEKMKEDNDDESGMPGGFRFDRNSMPNPEDLHGHLKGLFEGKIGTLAQELAEEISQDFGDILGDTNGEEPTSTQDVLKKMMKNPKKIMDLMKTVSSKLDKKMKDGDISKDEIMKEATEWMSKMKDMGGSDQFNEMFKNLTKNMGGLGKNMKIDQNALERMTKTQAMKERMRNKLEQRRQKAIAQAALNQSNSVIQESNTPNNYVFRMENEGVQEKTYISKKQQDQEIDDIMAKLDIKDEPKTTTQPTKKSKKNKNKK